MSIIFENDIDIIVSALEKIISYARDIQYIVLALSVWWISSIIRLQRRWVIHNNNLKKCSETIIATSPNIKEVSATPGDTQEESRSGVELQHIHPDRVFQVKVVITTVRDRRVGSGFGFDPEPNRCNGSYHTKTRTVAIGPVLPPKTQHYKSTIFAPIKYLSSDHIVTWSVGKLYSFSPSSTSRSQICGRTNIHRVAIEIPRILPEKWRYFTAIWWILVQSQIWQREVKERLKLPNLHTDHIVIRSELKYLSEAEVAGTIIRNRGPGSTRPENGGCMSGPEDKPAKTERVGLIRSSWPGPWPSGQFQSGPKPGNPEPLPTLGAGYE